MERVPVGPSDYRLAPAVRSIVRCVTNYINNPVPGNPHNNTVNRGNHPMCLLLAIISETLPGLGCAAVCLPSMSLPAFLVY